ncbi:unnamed protein product [Prorocentrum cordatum]|uniref:Uncharacterized protein n=1 Tax=Prorocentrum cordatum TaxID=2364126 RepID=A0ABN9VQ87_9DINO|nr:unnamed protein product [Polarella glacialis]CAK0894716.1 unnamed protein product [Polarella glacialis]
MDHLPDLPLIGLAPLSARSAGSSCGNTARSSEGKGTPREHEWHHLGARPPRTTSSGAVVPRLVVDGVPRAVGSPLATARGLSSPSSPTSSRCAASSRSLTELQDAVHLAAGPSPRSSRGAAPGCGAVPPQWAKDLSREIEIMRHVILQENSRLRAHIQEEKEALRLLRGWAAHEQSASAAGAREVSGGSVPWSGPSAGWTSPPAASAAAAAAPPPGSCCQTVPAAPLRGRARPRGRPGRGRGRAGRAGRAPRVGRPAWGLRAAGAPGVAAGGGAGRRRGRGRHRRAPARQGGRDLAVGGWHRRLRVFHARGCPRHGALQGSPVVRDPLGRRRGHRLPLLALGTTRGAAAA